MGPMHPHSDQVHAEKYRGPGESFREAMGRVAQPLSDNDDHYKAFRSILLDMRFLPAGRIQAAVGSPKHITPYNCFVSGTIHDSFTHGFDGRGTNSIMDIAQQAAQTMRMGGGIGYDFSTLRPGGDLIRGVQSRTDGPLAFMPINDAVCKATSSAGNRRGAQMGVLRIDHPDAYNFIRAKQPSAATQALWDLVDDLPSDWPGLSQLRMSLQATLPLTGFNFSLAITDAFMEAKAANKPFDLTFEGKVYNTVDPHELWEMLMRSTWDWGDPGVLFIDTINEMNNLWYCEKIAATNPCGEQPLPPYGACLLGSINLVKYLTKNADGSWSFDWALFAEDIPAIVRAMDNVVDYASYPLPQQQLEARNKRRMGLGITALANCAEALGHPYGSVGFQAFEAKILKELAVNAYQASMLLAKEKGAFPLFDADKYCQSKFIQAVLPPELIADIRKYGIRNSHLTSIAPTGTISYAADNVSSAIEPVFGYQSRRRMKLIEGEVEVDTYDYAFKHLGVEGKLAADVTAQEHVEVLCVAANLVDSAVSKTCNVPADMAWSDFKGVYDQAWEHGAKGCTTFNLAGKKMGIMQAVKPNREERPTDPRSDVPMEDVGGSCEIDFATGRRSCE